MSETCRSGLLGSECRLSSDMARFVRYRRYIYQSALVFCAGVLLILYINARRMTCDQHGPKNTQIALNPLLPKGNATHFLEYYTLEDAQVLFHRYVTRRDVSCTHMDRVGELIEGGYEICIMTSFLPSPRGCLVYSFGIGDNWSFDDGMHKSYDCQVHSFDPSINRSSYTRSEGHFFHKEGIWGWGQTTKDGWKLKSLTEIKHDLGHTDEVIDILKIDVEGAEWTSLRAIIDKGETARIKQIVIEIHSPRFRASHDKVDKRDFIVMLDIFMDLQRAGFRKYLYHSDKYCCSGFADLVPYSVAKQLICCYELFFININFMENPQLLN